MYVADEGSSEEEFGAGKIDVQECYSARVDQELKDNLLRKYSGYISSLKHGFSNKKKKGSLPREARETMLDWWSIHYKWPYPTVQVLFKNYIQLDSHAFLQTLKLEITSSVSLTI